MNEKRKQFLETFATQVKGIEIKKLNEESENMKPTIGEIADGYKKFVNELGEGFLKLAEAYNQCIEIAKSNEVIGDASLKIRIKDFSSALKNSEEKILDDVFGMQIVTPTEKEKEFFILFNHLLFDMQKDKEYNKKNGYIAYHCTGDFSLKDEDVETKVKELIKTAQAREYKYSKSKPLYEKNKMVSIFPELSKKNQNSAEFKMMIQTLKEMLELMKIAEIKRGETPITEFHFMTSEVEQESIRGTANHAAYKKGKSILIRQFFRDARLFRGINSPWKFEADKNGLHLQDFYETLLENWPFLKQDIITRRREGKEQKDLEKNSKFDILLASQFPFLRKYIGKDDSEYPEKYQAEKWGVLKGILIANRIDFSKGFEKLGQTILDGIGEIW